MRKLLIVVLALFAMQPLVVSKTFSEPYYRYRIKNLPEDLQIVETGGEGPVIFGTAASPVALFRLASSDEDSRFTFGYLEQLDSLVLMVLPSRMTSRKAPFFSNKITRLYVDEKGRKIKTVAIFARRYMYVFAQVYEEDTQLLDFLVDNFKSSRTGCIQNILAVVEDKIAGESPVLRAVMKIAASLILMAWATLIILGLWLYVIKPAIDRSLLQTVLLAIPCLFIIFYLTLHDYLMDWLMGYGSFGAILFNFLKMFIDD
ncbi:MAG: hypothetical protein IJU68_00240 [Bacteroidales bacterium]|nr:hypothetical protein [Bacteroidales bacterium]